MDKGIQLNVNLGILGVRHCQGRGREFESRFPLQIQESHFIAKWLFYCFKISKLDNLFYLISTHLL